MNTYVHLFSADMNWLLKNCATCGSTLPRGSVGRRVASRKTLLQRFLLATTAGKVFPQPPNFRAHPRHPGKILLLVTISAHQWLKIRSEIFAFIRACPSKLEERSRVYSRLKNPDQCISGRAIRSPEPACPEPACPEPACPEPACPEPVERVERVERGEGWLKRPDTLLIA